MADSYDLSGNLNGPNLVTPLSSSPNASKYLEQLRESRSKLMSIAKSYQRPDLFSQQLAADGGGNGRGAGSGSLLPTSAGRISVPALLIRQGEKIEAMKQQLFQAQTEEQQLAMRLRTADIEKEKLAATLASNLQQYEEDAAAAEAARQEAEADNQQYVVIVVVVVVVVVVAVAL